MKKLKEKLQSSPAEAAA